MRYGPPLPADAPDPQIGAVANARTMPVPARTLVAQPALERFPHPSVAGVSAGGAPTSMEVSWSYTLRRVPADPCDPANLVDAATLASLEGMPPAPAPAWLVDMVERMRHPMLWEAVRTTWRSVDDRSPGDPLVDAVVRHVTHVGVDRFEEAHGADVRWDRPELVAPGALRDTELLVDGRAVPGIVVDGDPHVLGLGAVLADGAMLSAALPRDALEHLDVAFATVEW